MPVPRPGARSLGRLTAVRRWEVLPLAPGRLRPQREGDAMREPDSKRRPRALFIRDLVPVRGGVPRPPDVPQDAQVTSMMVGEESDSGPQR